MGSLALSDLLTEVRSGLGNRTDAGTSTQALVNALNLAQQRIERRWPWRDLKTIGLAQMSFTGNPAVDKFMSLPANLKILHSFVLLDTSAGIASLGQSKKLVQKPWRWFDDHFPSPEWLPPGWPEIYAHWGDKLVLNRAPFLQFTAMLRMDVFPTPFSVNNLGQQSDYRDKDDILINWTLGYKHRSYGRLDRATYHENLVEGLINEAIEFDDRQPDIDISRDVGALTMTSSDSGAYWADPWVHNAP